MNKIFNKKQLVKHGIILLVIALLITYVIPFALSGQVGTSSRVITFSFEGIGQGKDPKGNYFDINVLKSNKVLKAAIKKSGLEDKMTVKELRNLIAIVPHVSDKALSDLTSFSPVGGTSSTQDIAQRSVHPSQYTIELKDRGIPSAFRDRKLLANVIEAYTEFLENSYLQDATDVQAYTKKEIMALDYLDMIDVLEQQTESLGQFVNNLAKTSSKFVDEKSGMSFADVSEQIDTLRNVDLGSVSGMVKYYQLTNNVADRTKYENSRLRRTSFQIERRWAKQITRQNMTEMYDNTQNDVYLMWNGELTGQTSGEGSDDVFYSNLVSQLINSKSDTVAIQNQKAEIEKAIATLGNSGLTQQEYAAKLKEADVELEAVIDKLDALRSQAKTLAKANYDQNIASKIATKRVSYDLNGGSLLVNLVILILIYAVWMTARETEQVKRALVWMRAKSDFVKENVLSGKKAKESDKAST